MWSWISSRVRLSQSINNLVSSSETINCYICCMHTRQDSFHAHKRHWYNTSEEIKHISEWNKHTTKRNATKTAKHGGSTKIDFNPWCRCHHFHCNHLNFWVLVFQLWQMPVDKVATHNMYHLYESQRISNTVVRKYWNNWNR